MNRLQIHAGNDAGVPGIRKNTSGSDVSVTDLDVLWMCSFGKVM